MRETELYIDTGSELIRPSGEPYPSLQGTVIYWHYLWSIQKAIPWFYQASSFRMLQNMVRPVSSKALSLFLLFLLCCEVSSLIKSNVVWDTMMKDKAFCKSTENSYSKSIVCENAKSVPRVCIYFRNNEILPSL